VGSKKSKFFDDFKSFVAKTHDLPNVGKQLIEKNSQQSQFTARQFKARAVHRKAVHRKYNSSQKQNQMEINSPHGQYTVQNIQ
jgi:hypothetical protein